MKKFLIVLAFVSLAGCAQIKSAYDAVTGATVSPEAVVLASSAFDAVEITATNYLRLRKCTDANRPICRDPAVTPMLIGSVRSGRVARNNLKQFLRDHPGQLGPQGDYDALVTATGTIKSALAAYQSAR